MHVFYWHFYWICLSSQQLPLCLWGSETSWLTAKCGVKVVLPYLGKILPFMSMLPTPLNNQLGQNQPTSVLIFLSVYKGNRTGQPCASAPAVTGSTGSSGITQLPSNLPHTCPQPSVLHEEGWANPKEEEFPTPLALLWPERTLFRLFAGKLLSLVAGVELAILPFLPPPTPRPFTSSPRFAALIFSSCVIKRSQSSVAGGIFKLLQEMAWL